RPANAAVGLPAVYFGTVDASPLFVVLLAQAWRWGLPAAEVAALLPAARAALAWLTTHGDPDGDGFIKYLPAGHGLVNQGWKDSSDGVQHADGRLATPPVALVEVQGYAYRAAMDGAALLDAFGEPGGDRWREWAGQLAARFRDAFWVSDVDGSYPAIALEAGNKLVDGPSSNMGHLLGTGLLTPQEEALVARRLAGPALDSGYGLRTLAGTAAGFNPLSYHAGSVWPHDTAIAVRNLALSGHSAPAAALLCGLLGAAAGFGYRLPELYGGQRAEPPLPPVPYPAACRPQAWAAAAGLAMVQALLGLDVDVPGGRLRLRPIAPSPVGAYSVRNIRLGCAGTLHVDVDAAGRVVRAEAPASLRVEVTSPEQR
ncbi:MAG TPA: amylo-alpha-1,6-glucosidase, partial [Micromonosporaceae bacterium]|nr:amylo-alpha-1,6-glucosidase [Micromonosporaceae bacterium]